MFRNWILAVMAITLAAHTARAEPRVALVIGNSHYKYVSGLSNPQNDARLMADTLRELKFDVIEVRDADRRGMVRAMREFGDRLSAGGSKAVGLFYYAGHGVQARNTNFLLPLRATIESEEDLVLEAVDAKWILRQMERAGNSLNIVILDACRNNPYKGSFRSVSRGLQRINAPSGSLIAYSAAPGQVAADGSGRHSPYTSALASAMKRPGMELLRVFRQARIAVESQTGGRQTPWEEQSLKRDFYFVPDGRSKSANRPLVDRSSQETVFWKSIKDDENAAMFEEFLRQFPNGTFAGLARLRLKELETKVAVGVFPDPPKSLGKPTPFRSISIGTGGVTGVYYPTGGAICRLVNKDRKTHGVRCSAESTGGSIYNINTVRAGELDFGLAQSDWQHHAWQGTSKFRDAGKFSKLRSIFSVHPEPVTMIARDGSGIRNVTDARGKRLNIGNPGSGTRGAWEVLEYELGWRRSDLKLAAGVRAQESAAAACDGKIDAFFWLIGHPSALTQESLARCAAHLVHVSGPAVDRLVAERPYYRKTRIPAGMYNNKSDIETYGVGATVVTSADVPEDIVYLVVKSVFDNFETFRKLHPAFSYLKPDEMIRDSLSAPLHAGALRYYREKGWM